MKSKEKSDWSWPMRGETWDDVEQIMKNAAALNIDYRNSSPLIMGFPGTSPLFEAVRAREMFVNCHPNNIGYHTGKDAEMGFCGTQMLEQWYVWAMGELLGAEDPLTEIDGYICHGGSDANDHGVWIGRNKLWKEQSATSGRKGIALLTSILGHYSIRKAFDRLLAQGTEWRGLWRQTSNLFKELPTNSAGELDADIVERAVRDCHAAGYRRFILCLTAGTTNLGSVDKVEDICKRLEEIQKGWRDKDRIAIHIHVDAALGGYILPFVEPTFKFAFQNPMVGSVCVDPHKMGLVPYAAGLFLCRKGNLEYTKTDAHYVHGNDHTVIGSRAGDVAAACWAAMRTMGKEGYELQARNCLAMRDYLKKGLDSLNRKMSLVKFYPSRLNVLTVKFGDEVTEALTEGGEKSLRNRHCIPDDFFPADLTNPRWDGNMAVRDTRVFRFVAMPHYTKRGVDEFLSSLEFKL